MKLKSSVIAIALFSSITSASAEPWTLDASANPALSTRTFLKPETVAVYQKKAEELVGRWGILRADGIVELTADRPASFSQNQVPVVKVSLSEAKPAYRSVVSSSAAAKAAIPVLNVNLASNQKAMIQVTDIAQFLTSGLPVTSDWGNNAADPGVGKPRLVYVGAAVLSLVETSIIKKKSGTASFLSFINLGASGDYEEESNSMTYVLSVAFYEPTCRMLGTCSAPSINNLNLSPLTSAVKSVDLTTDSATERLGQ